MPVLGGSISATTQYAASLVVSTSSGVLQDFSGYNNGGAKFIQVHNGTAVPNNGATPVYFQAVAGTANFQYLNRRPIPCTTGIVICNSTTGPTLTAGTADCWIHAWQ